MNLPRSVGLARTVKFIPAHGLQVTPYLVAT